MPDRSLSRSLQPVPRQRLYEQLMERLLAFVAESKLSPGDRLPSERTLAERLGVSRNSLRQATMALEIQGIVETRHGGGIYLSNNDRPPEPISALIDRRSRLPDILEAREAIEVKLAELAATRRTDNDLSVMRQALVSMQEDIHDGHLGEEGDRQFHAAVVAAGNSPILARFYNELRTAISETRVESLRQPGRPRVSLAQHERILDAIESGDAKRAARTARHHITTVGQVRLLELDLDVDDH